VKCTTNRGCALSQRWIAGVLLDLRDRGDLEDYHDHAARVTSTPGGSALRSRIAVSRSPATRFARGLTGEIIARFERKGLRIVRGSREGREWASRSGARV
jgi:hypothetical protein